jgi:tetratricopeptide (TPR) repeat protein
MTYQYLHIFDSALIYHQKAIDLMPGWSAPYANKFQTLLMKNGIITEAQKLIDEATSKTGDSLIQRRIIYNIYRKNYYEALQEVTRSRPDNFDNGGSRQLTLALIYKCLNNQGLAKISYDSARVILQTELVNDQQNYFKHAALGIAYAGLGEKDKSIEEGEKAINLALNNGFYINDMRENMALIYTLTGDYGHALSSIEYLLSNPSQLSVNILLIDPQWKPLMDVPEFKRVLKKYSKL